MPVFGLVRNISETVIIPIAGMFLTFIACYELIQMIIEHNNLANFETWIFFKSTLFAYRLRINGKDLNFMSTLGQILSMILICGFP